jgi:hypothetical protein
MLPGVNQLVGSAVVVIKGWNGRRTRAADCGSVAAFYYAACSARGLPLGAGEPYLVANTLFAAPSQIFTAIMALAKSKLR